MQDLQPPTKSSFKLAADKRGIHVPFCGFDHEEKLGKMQLEFPIGPFCVLFASGFGGTSIDTPLRVLLLLFVALLSSSEQSMASRDVFYPYPYPLPATLRSK